MESLIWPEISPSNRIKMIQALTRGEEWTNKLREFLRSGKIEPNSISIDDVVVQIVGMFENTLSIMSSRSLINEPHQAVPTSDLHSLCNSDGRKSEISDEISPRTIIPAVKMKRGCYTRRKHSWTSTKVTSELVDDGHAWRKYGQKEILNKKYQRSYYRCTYKFDRGCQATKQVQKMEDKPSNYKITYFGHHTCKDFHRAPPIILDSQDPTDHTSIFLNFETKGVIEKKQVEPYFPTMKYEHQDTISNSSNAYQSWDLSTQYIPQIPSDSVSMLSSKFEHTDMTSSEMYSGLDQGADMTISGASSLVYEMNHMFWNE